MNDKVVRNSDKIPNDRIQKLWGNFGDLTPDELAQRIRRVRQDRRKRKEKTVERKTRVTKSDTAKQKMEKMLDGLTAEQIAKIMEGM
jgi:hypothetical protein